jgi:hypothetical protein
VQASQQGFACTLLSQIATTTLDKCWYVMFGLATVGYTGRVTASPTAVHMQAMRQVANQKLEMNDTKAQERALANGRDGQVLLGGLALPECVLQGKGLRALLEAQQQAAPVSGLIQGEVAVQGCSGHPQGKAWWPVLDPAPARASAVVVPQPVCDKTLAVVYWPACSIMPSKAQCTNVWLTRQCNSCMHAALEMCVGADSACKGKTGGSGAGSGCGSPRQPTGKQWMAGSSRKAQEVEGFVASLSRNGFLTAPPDEFLALMTDWRSARTNSHAEPQ